MFDDNFFEVFESNVRVFHTLFKHNTLKGLILYRFDKVKL